MLHPFPKILASLLLLLATPTALAAAAPATATLASEPVVTRAFLASDLAARLRALLTQPLAAVAVAPDEVLVAYYVPKQGALSEWDDETRIDQYHWDGRADFRRKAFVTKAGQGLKGRLAGWVLRDLDGDGRPELVAIAHPTGLLNKVAALMLRRAGPTDPYKVIWRRSEFAAALRVAGHGLAYTYQERQPPYTRHFEQLALVAGELRPQ